MVGEVCSVRFNLLLQEGLAWWYEKYAPDESPYRLLERQARRDKKGLWVDPEPVLPREWRKKTIAAQVAARP